jgi:hypothetical protein
VLHSTQSFGRDCEKQNPKNIQKERDLKRQEIKGTNSGQKTKLAYVTKTVLVRQGQEEKERRKLSDMHLQTINIL